MKKIFSIAAALVVFAACEKLSLDMPVNDESASFSVQDSQTGKKVKNFTFTIKGDFDSPTFTRAYMSADGKMMTDLWVFDYVDGKCVQMLHQSPTDEDWGIPKMALEYGSHHVYFVASRGTAPTVNAEGNIISWEITSDTFWKDYEVTVVNSSNGNRAVELARVVTKLVLKVEQALPMECAKISIAPETWYYGLNYVTGEATLGQKKERIIAVPESYLGIPEKFEVTMFGISGELEWTTDINIIANDESGKVLGSASIENAPFKRNRGTHYTGNLFVPASDMDVSLSDEWTDAVQKTF